MERLFLSLGLNFAYALLSLAFLLTLANQVMGIFVDASEQEVIGAGSVYLKNMAIYYLAAAVTYIFQGVHRGAGNLNVVFLATSVQITLRVLLTFALVPDYGIPGVAFAIFAGWILMIVIDVLFFFRLKKVVKANSNPAFYPSEAKRVSKFSESGGNSEARAEDGGAISESYGGNSDERNENSDSRHKNSDNRSEN